MANAIELHASVRAKAGKGAARATRREGRVPAVIYGDKKDPQLVSFSYKDLWQQVQTGRFLATLVDVNVDGKKVRTIPRDIQFDPVRDFLIHADFLRLGKGARITVDVPVNFINQDDCQGIKRGGVLNVVRYEVQVYCPADAIPESFDVDLAGLDIGDGRHISNVDLPDGVTPTITDRDFTICTIAAPAGMQETDEAGEDDELATGAGEVPTLSDEQSDDAQGDDT